MTAPLPGGLTPETRERLIRADLVAPYCDKCRAARKGLHPMVGDMCVYCAAHRVDALVSALVAEGWRHLPSVIADDEAQAGVQP